MSYSKWPAASKWLVFLAILLFCSGCAQMKTFFKPKSDSAEAKADSASEQESYYAHKVRWEGETLSLIAKWYTGDQKNWKVLAKANPWLDPNDISTGHKIFIPRSILKTSKRMPHDFVLASTGKGGVQKTESVKTEKAGGNLSEAEAAELDFVVP